MPITQARTGNPADANPGVAGVRAVTAGHRAGTTAIVEIIMTAVHAATVRAMMPVVIGPRARGHAAAMIAVESRNVRKHLSWI